MYIENIEKKLLSRIPCDLFLTKFIKNPDTVFKTKILEISRIFLIELSKMSKI